MIFYIKYEHDEQFWMIGFLLGVRVGSGRPQDAERFWELARAASDTRTCQDIAAQMASILALASVRTTSVAVWQPITKRAGIAHVISSNGAEVKT